MASPRANASSQPGIRSRRFSGVKTRDSGCSPSGRSRPMYVTGPSGIVVPSHSVGGRGAVGHQVDEVPDREVVALDDAAQQRGDRHLVSLDLVGVRVCP